MSVCELTRVCNLRPGLGGCCPGEEEMRKATSLEMHTHTHRCTDTHVYCTSFLLIPWSSWQQQFAKGSDENPD